MSAERRIVSDPFEFRLPIINGIERYWEPVTITMLELWRLIKDGLLLSITPKCEMTDTRMIFLDPQYTVQLNELVDSRGKVSYTPWTAVEVIKEDHPYPVPGLIKAAFLSSPFVFLPFEDHGAVTAVVRIPVAKNKAEFGEITTKLLSYFVELFGGDIDRIDIKIKSSVIVCRDQKIKSRPRFNVQEFNPKEK
jgi:hypothetical protein